MRSDRPDEPDESDNPEEPGAPEQPDDPDVPEQPDNPADPGSIQVTYPDDQSGDVTIRGTDGDDRINNLLFDDPDRVKTTTGFPQTDPGDMLNHGTYLR